MLLSLSTAGAWLYMHTRRSESIKQPEITWEQTSTYIKVHLRNRNRHWGLKNQRLQIYLARKNGEPLFLYGPDEDASTTLEPDKKLRCCLIPTLAPNEEFTFTLLPIPQKVEALEITLRGGPGWVRM